MQLAQWLIGLLAVFGHGAFWVAAFNRAHAVGWPYRLVNLLEKVILFFLLGGLALLVAWIGQSGQLFLDPLAWLGRHVALDVYFWLCFGTGLSVLAAWLWRTWSGESSRLVRSERQILRVDRRLGKSPCGDRLARIVAGMPGNDVFHLEINQKELVVARLPCELDGLSVVHLSDLHFTGRVSREFFDVAVQSANALQPDLVAITGDIIDREQCLAWMGDVLGQLRARFGVFFVLGNHDLRLGDVAPLVRAIEDAGPVHVGGRWLEVRVRGQPVIVAGNELPWLGPAADMRCCAWPEDRPRPLRLLLSHSPDQIDWARRFDFDLMLAGHMHGGQIRLPIAGPIVGPSYRGVKYSGGVHYAAPTVLHVSRGVSAAQPLRIGCRPEISRLVLRPSFATARAEQGRTLDATRANTASLPAPARVCPADRLPV